MKEDRLSGLALMHIHKHDMSLDSEDIVDDFSQLATEKIAILTLSSPDLTLVKRRQFYELCHQGCSV